MMTYAKGVEITFLKIAFATIIQRTNGHDRTVVNMYRIIRPFVFCRVMLVTVQVLGCSQDYTSPWIQKYVTEVFSSIANAAITKTIDGLGHTVQSGSKMIDPSVFYRVVVMLALVLVHLNWEMKIYTGQKMREYARKVKTTFSSIANAIITQVT